MPRGRRKRHGSKRGRIRSRSRYSSGSASSNPLTALLAGARRLFGISAPISQVRDAYGSEVAEAYASQVSINTSTAPKIEVLERLPRVILLDPETE